MLTALICAAILALWLHGFYSGRVNAARTIMSALSDVQDSFTAASAPAVPRQSEVRRNTSRLTGQTYSKECA